MTKVPIVLGLLAVAALGGQQPPVLPPGFVKQPFSPPVQQPSGPQPVGPQAAPPPAPAKPGTPGQAQPAPAPAEPGKAPAAPAPAQVTSTTPASITPAPSGGMFLNFQNASLTEVLDILARRLKINYILDPRVKVGGKA